MSKTLGSVTAVMTFITSVIVFLQQAKADIAAPSDVELIVDFMREPTSLELFFSNPLVILGLCLCLVLVFVAAIVVIIKIAKKK